MLRKLLTIAFISLIAAAVFENPAEAAAITVGNPFASYGTVQNANCGIGGICAAAEAENSFIFLSNYYMSTYAGTNITTGGAGTQAGAAMDFGVSGDGFCGYYSRFSAMPCAPNHGVNGNYVDTLNDWLNAYAPGTSYVVSNTNGNQGANLLTMFIGPQLQAHEDVELFIYNLGQTSGHVISPFSITYDPLNPAAGGSMSYQDPNAPTMQQMVTITINNNGQIQFTDPISGLGTVTVTAGFAESPIPEPGTFSLVSIAALCAVGLFRRRSPGGRHAVVRRK